MTTWELVTADVLDWAASYDGPKFHALLSDPSYALSKKKSMVLEAIANLPSKPTNAQVIAAYHALQQWGDTGFMGKAWDTDVAFNPDTWAALAEHLHPGAFGMAFASSRGWHRLAVAIEDAGMVIQPSIFGWANGQSFPKATRIDTQIDKRAGKLGEREVVSDVGTMPDIRANNYSNSQDKERLPNYVTAPATPLARAWVGHRYGGQILKNALEPIIVFQKPWENKRLDCIVETGAGSMWVDGTRIEAGQEYREAGWGPRFGASSMPNMGGHQTRPWVQRAIEKGKPVKESQPSPQGRWPANFTLTHHPDCRRVGTRRVKKPGGNGPKSYNKDCDVNIPLAPGGWDSTKSNVSHYDENGYETVTAWDCVPECPVRRLGEMSGESKSRSATGIKRYGRSGGIMGKVGALRDGRPEGHNDTGTAARFYFQACWSFEVAERLAMADPVKYQSKASRKERDAGLAVNSYKKGGTYEFRQDGSLDGDVPYKRNPHPTVKPIALTRWLATLLLPPPEYVPRRLLIPFSGSGSEGIGAGLAGWEKMTLIDFKAENNEIAEVRLQHWLNRRQLELGI